MDPQIISMEEDKFLNQMEMMYTKKDTFVTAAWCPHWMIGAYDLNFLVDTSFSFGESDEIHAYGYPEIKNENADLAQLVSRMFLNDEHMNELLDKMKGKSSPEEYEQVAKSWIAENRELVDGWLGKLK
jgi:glycine betaine/proline transport system substrate-binding protein